MRRLPPLAMPQPYGAAALPKGFEGLQATMLLPLVGLREESVYCC